MGALETYSLGLSVSHYGLSWWFHLPMQETQVRSLGQEDPLEKGKPVFLNTATVGCHVHLFATLWTAARQASLPSTISQNLLKFMSIESVILSNHLILCCSLLFLLSFFPSTRVFPSEFALCIRWPKFWSFCFSNCY